MTALFVTKNNSMTFDKATMWSFFIASSQENLSSRYYKTSIIIG